MWQSVSRNTIEDVVGTHIYKLPPKGLQEHFIVPITLALTMFSEEGAFSMGQLGCRNLRDIVNVLEMNSEKIANGVGRSIGATIKKELEKLLLKPVKSVVDKEIGFDEKKFADSCEVQRIDPGTCHILMPLHVSESLKATLDNNQAMYGVDNHVYLTRDYLMEYGAKVVYDALPRPVMFNQILSNQN